MDISDYDTFRRLRKTESLRLISHMLSFSILSLLLVARYAKSSTLETLHRSASMKSATHLAKWLVLLVVISSAEFLLAQGTDLGTITGSVTDSSGALVPNATVTILDLATNTPR